MLNKNSYYLQAALFYAVITTPLLAVDIQKISFLDFIEQFPDTICWHTSGKYAFDQGKYPMQKEDEPSQPITSGYFLDSFVLSVPQATVLFDTKEFYAYVNNYFINETNIRLMEPTYLCDFCNKTVPENIPYLDATVALVTNSYGWCYFHWFNDIVSKLTLLECNGITYDYICIPQYRAYMQETLQLWGIDSAKIIPAQLGMCFMAKNLLVPTSPAALNPEIQTSSNFMQPMVLHTLRNKLINPAIQKSTQRFCQKIFISRKDAHGRRPIANEDEIFQLLQSYGFERYNLAHMPLHEQIALFNQATDIISFHGAGLTNIMFCQPNTRIIEIFYNHYCIAYWSLSKTLDLEYHYIDGMNGQKLMHADHIVDPVPLPLIENFLETIYTTII